VNGRRTYAFAEDVGTLTIPGEKNVNASCIMHAITRSATHPCNTSTFGAGEPGSDIVLKNEMKIVAAPSHVYSKELTKR